jgi:hypothetical protein
MWYRIVSLVMIAFPTYWLVNVRTSNCDLLLLDYFTFGVNSILKMSLLSSAS